MRPIEALPPMTGRWGFGSDVLATDADAFLMDLMAADAAQPLPVRLTPRRPPPPPPRPRRERKPMSEALIRNALNGNGEDHGGTLPQTLDMDIDVMFHAQRVTSLHLEEPTGAQYEKAVQELASGVNAYTLERFKISLIANTAKVDRTVVLGLRKSQIEEAYSFLSRLLANGLPTGEI
jgi:hypothetical protein